MVEQTLDGVPFVSHKVSERSDTLEESLTNIMNNSPNLSYRIFAEALLQNMHKTNMNLIAIVEIMKHLDLVKKETKKTRKDE